MLLAILLVSAFPLYGQDSPADTQEEKEFSSVIITGIHRILEAIDPEDERMIQAETAQRNAAQGLQEGMEANSEIPEDQNSRALQRRSILRRLIIAAIIILIQAIIIAVIWLLFKHFDKVVLTSTKTKIKPLTIKKARLLSTKQIVNLIEYGLKIAKYIITAFQLYLTIPLVFSLFPLTQNLAATLFGYILNPLKTILLGIVFFIPNLITIIIILMITRYVLRGIKFLATQIEREKLVLPGFYAEWAHPTYNILRVLLYAFTVVVIYPYLPGSGSPVFQGVSVFVGVIFSLGSSSAISNLMAGFVITYMRPFKIGDRIQVQGVIGNVVEKSLIVVRIKTNKNEYVTFPNQMILGSNIINYYTSVTEEEEGLILHASITMGYAIPWTKVHELLIGAALATTDILETPKPYVLQSALDDYYAHYEINAYTKAVDRIPGIYSELYHNIQDQFKNAGIDMTAPSYQVRLTNADSKAKVTTDIPLEPNNN